MKEMKEIRPDANTILFLLRRSLTIPAPIAMMAVANIETDRKNPRKSSVKPPSTMYKLKITELNPKAKDPAALEATNSLASLLKRRILSTYPKLLEVLTLLASQVIHWLSANTLIPPLFLADMALTTRINRRRGLLRIMPMIDLRSDTFTLPTDEMIQAIRNAHREGKLGDDVAGEDEVVNELQAKAADILGKEQALLVTSGTQGNLVSLFAQTVRGDEVVMEKMSHTFLFEGGAMASLGGLFPKPVEGTEGYIEPDTLQATIHPDDAHYPRTAIVVVENTHNYAGGKIIKPEQIDALSEVAHDNNLKVHCDGARLFNAAVALDIPAKRLVRSVDSVQICLSKGLSAPVGSIIAGTEEFIHEAHRWRKKMGGGMRQAGIIAAPGIVALEEMVDRLQEDHDNAQLLFHLVSKMPELDVEEPDTNIMFVNLDGVGIDAGTFAKELKKRNVLVYGEYGTRVRFVTNRMVSQEDMRKVANAIEQIVLKYRD